MESQFEKLYRLYEKDWWWFVGRHSLISKIFSSLEIKDDKVLEIGCGSGENSKIFSKPFSYYGIDISSVSIQSGNRSNKNLMIGDGGSMPFRDKTFDAVLLLDVLEHLQDEKSSIEEAYRVLKDDGSLLVLAPAFEILWGNHDILNQHKRRYTRGKLVSKIIDGKFIIYKISYWNFFLFIPIVLMKIIKDIINTGEADFANIPNTLNNTILLNLLKIENCLIEKGIYLPIGVSIFCVCKKNIVH